MSTHDKIKKIDACLPQTQCGACGYPGCRPYAAAIAHGQADIGNCPPGGLKTLHALANLLSIDAQPFEAEVQSKAQVAQTAIINTMDCIGCTKCLPACPVDAIIGTAKQLHQVISHECTGCGLCVEPCPVDCITIHPVPEPQYDPDLARQRYQSKQVRALQATQKKEQVYQQKRHAKQQKNINHGEQQSAKRDYILEALSRVQSKKK